MASRIGSGIGGIFGWVMWATFGLVVWPWIAWSGLASYLDRRYSAGGKFENDLIGFGYILTVLWWAGAMAVLSR